VISALNFYWLHQTVLALSGKRILRRAAVGAALRYVLLGGGAYVILRFSKIDRLATLAGVFIAVAAVIVEIVIELVYARN
jgi:hypothetical protein